MTEQRISNGTANLAVAALEVELVLRKKELQELEAAMEDTESTVTVKKVMDMMAQKTALEEKVRSVQDAIYEIKSNQSDRVKVQTGGGCTG